MRPAIVAAAISLAPVAFAAFAIAFGGPHAPPPMASLRDPFLDVDFSGLPPVSRFAARDGAALAYRAYAPSGGVPRGSAVLVHGSSARGQSMHPLAVALSRAGFAAYALDVRGHGDSGPRGRISYVGQLEDDLEDFLAAVAPARPRVLMGFSSGGGFVLRFAADERRTSFDAYVLLAPFLHQDAPTFRASGGGWVELGVPRFVALTVLDRVGVTWFHDLPVAAFALDAADRERLTPTYSFTLAANFRPHNDFPRDVREAARPMEVLVGADDEVFRPERFSEIFDGAARVTIVPGVDHVGLTLRPPGIDAAVSAATSALRRP